MNNRIIPVLKQWVPLILLNFLVTIITLYLVINNQGRNVIWLPTGVALSLMITLGSRFWISIVFGVFPAVLVMSGSIQVAVIITVANTIYALITFYLLKRSGFNSSFRRLKDLFQLLFLSIPSTFVGSATAVIFYYFGKSLLGLNLINQGLIMWAADILSILVVVPLVLIWREPLKKLNGRLIEAGLLFIVLVLVTLKFSYRNINEIDDFYLYFPLLSWAGLRFGRRGASAAILLVIIIITSLYTFRAFSGNNPTTDILVLQISMIIVSVTSLSLAMIIYERKQAEEKLKEVNDHLEQMVNERTIALRTEICEREKFENSLRESEEKYRNIVESSVDGIMLIDDKGNILEWNRGLEEITGISKIQVLGEKYDEIIFNTDWYQKYPETSEYYQKMFHNDISRNASRFVFLRPDGENRTIQLVFLEVESGKKRLQGAIIRDITEQEQFANAIYKYAQRLEVLHGIDHAILEASSLDNLINTLLPNLRRLVNAHWVNIVTYDKENEEVTYLGIDYDHQINGESIRYFEIDMEKVPPKVKKGELLLIEDLQSYPAITKYLRTILTGGIHTFLIVPLLIKEEFIGAILLGAVKPNAFNHEQVEIAREVANEVAIAIQQTRLRERIWFQREELRQLTKKTINAQEEERRRLSRELHDEAGQALTALKINLELITSDLPMELDSFRQRLVEAVALTDDTMEQLRIIARGLRPPALDTFGINFALEDLCREFSRRSKIEVEYQGMDLPSVTEEINISLYRILQESLTNIYKHAHAEHITVELECKNGLISLTVSDNGKGFKKGKGVNGKKGIGLLGIKERLEMLGGNFELKSSSGQGSILRAFIPCDGKR